MKNRSLRAKLYALSGFLILISVTMGATGYYVSQRIREDYAKIDEISYPNTVSILEINSNFRAIRIDLLHLAMPNTPVEMDEKIIKADAERWEKIYAYVKEYEAIPMPSEEEALYKILKEGLTKGRQNFETAMKLYYAGDENSSSRKQMQIFLGGDMNSDTEKFRASVNELVAYHKEVAKHYSTSAIETSRMGTIVSLTLLAIGTILGVLFSVIFTTSLVKTLLGISTSLADSSAQVTSAASQIASSSEQLSQASTEQAASLEETAASIEEMSSMVGKNSENAKGASTVSDESHGSANKGKEVVEQMIQSMEQINESNTKIAEIVKVINEIGNKTKVINDIVFQTKLLSFNASVEAARAGEHGKGFAVVAEEVGNLAQMSGNAAKEISTMLEGSIQRVEGIVAETKVKVEQGTQIARQCGDVLNEIVSNVSKVSQMSGEISKASDEQSKGVQEITKAMAQLDQVTQQNAATSEEAASAAEELSAQAESLKSMVDTLVSTVNGTAGGAPAAAPTVVAAKKAAPAKTGGKVVHFKADAPRATPALKKAAGDGTPSYDDSRFDDV